MIGKIIKQISNDYTVEVNGKKYTCKPRGKFRNQNESPIVGDIVTFDEKTNVISEIHERKNKLVRPVIANVDQAIIITSVKKPDFSSNLLDKMLINVESKNIHPVICITKFDLLTKEEKKEIKKILNYYKKIGYKVVYNTNKLQIKLLLRKKISVLTGQTGAGKSTLLNKLNKQLNLKTSPISEALNRGVHTTRHVELLKIGNGLVADTPGFSSLDFDNLSKDEIKDCFVEFNKYICPFKDCMHLKEKKCKVKEAVENKEILKSRYDNYTKFIDG